MTAWRSGEKKMSTPSSGLVPPDTSMTFPLRAGGVLFFYCQQTYTGDGQLRREQRTPG